MKITAIMIAIMFMISEMHAANNLTGVYVENKPPHEEVNTLIVLPNNQFCFSAMSGNMDLLVAGEWSVKLNQIFFREHRNASDHFDVSGHADNTLEGKKIILNGITFSNARNTIMTIAPRASTPKTFKLLFKSGYNGWEKSYEIPAGQDHNASIFIAKALRYADGDKKHMTYKVYEYALEHPNNVMYVTFNRDSDRRNLNLDGTFDNKSISFSEGRSVLEKVGELTPKKIETIQQECVLPRLHKKNYMHQGAIVPLRSYEVTLPIPEEHYFASKPLPQENVRNENTIQDVKKAPKHYGFIDTKGRVVISPRFTNVGNFGANGLAPFEEEAKYGYINTKGKIVIPPHFETARDFSEDGLAIIGQECYTSHTETFLDKNEKPKTISIVHSPYCKYGYINTAGEMVISPMFDDVSPFDDRKLAIIEQRINDTKRVFNKQQGRYVLIDKDGKIVYQPSKYGLINKDGKIVVQPLYDQIWSDFKSYHVKLNGKEGLLDIRGKVVVPPQYSDIMCDDGFAKVKEKDTHGLIDTHDGKLIFPMQSEYISVIEGAIKFEKDGKFGFKNIMGEIIVAPIYDEVESFGLNGYAEVKKEGKWGYVNKKGKVMLPLVYDATTTFSENNVSAVKLHGQWHSINQKGEILATLAIEDAHRFSHNGFAEVLKDTKWGLMNVKGEMVIPAIYDEISFGSYKNAFLQVKQKGKWYFINKKGKILMEGTNRESLLIQSEKDSPKRAVVGNKFIYVNPQGELITSRLFDYISDEVHNDLIKVCIGDKFGFINTKGEMVIEPSFTDVSEFSNGFARIYQ